MSNFRQLWLQRLMIPAVLALVTALYMLPFFRPPTGSEVLIGHDLVNQQYPLYSLIFDSARNGAAIPLWNPYQFAGQSIANNPQSTIAYPPAWLMAPLGVPKAVGWLVALHLWFGAWGMAMFLRVLGTSRRAALAGGIVYGFSALMGAHLGAGHFNYILCQAWLPWIAAAYQWAIPRKPWWLAALPGMAALGMCILTGYPPLLYFGLLWLAVLWLFNVARAPIPRAALWRVSRPLLLIVVGGCLLGAAVLLPVGSFTLRSTRTQSTDLAFSSMYPLPGAQLITLVIPNLFGQPNLPDQGYWGVPFYEEVTAYVGILPLLAVFLARRRPAALLLLGMALGGIVVSLGVDGGLFTLLYRLLPGYQLFRVPARSLYFFTVGAAGLTAFLLDDLSTWSATQRRVRLRPTLRRLLPLFMMGAGALSVGLGAYFIAHSAEANPPWRSYFSSSMAALAVIFMGGAWGVLWAWSRRGSVPNVARALPLLAGVFLLADVWHISAPLVTVGAVDIPALWKTLQSVAPADPNSRVMTVPNRVEWQSGAEYTHQLNANGYDPLVDDAYQQLLDASGYNPTSPIAQLLGVRKVVSDKPYAESALTGAEHLTRLYPAVAAGSDGSDPYIYQTDNRIPRAFIAPELQVVRSADTARELLASESFDAMNTALVSSSINCPATLSTAAQPSVQRYEPNLVEIDTSTVGAGLLVLTDTFDADWQVSIDDVPAELIRVDTALRGVCLRQAARLVRFDYRPTAFILGVGISGLSWLALIVIGSLGVWYTSRRVYR